MKWTELKERATELFKGDLEISKLDFFLIGAICLLAGICVGLIAAPVSHGISLFSHNGYNNGNNDRGTLPGGKPGKTYQTINNNGSNNGEDAAELA